MPISWETKRSAIKQVEEDTKGMSFSINRTDAHRQVVLLETYIQVYKEDKGKRGSRVKNEPD